MIAAAEPSVFTPYGVEIVGDHPFFTEDPGISINKVPDWYTIHPPCTEDIPDINQTEDELYVAGKTVVWSRSSLTDSREVIKSFTMDSDVKQALWCTFYSQPDSPGFTNQVRPEQPQGDPMPSLCIFEGAQLTTFVATGAQYCTCLPFQLKKAWSTKFGLLMERKVNPMENCNLPKSFALLHPLEDITPVLLKKNNSVLYESNSFLQIFLTSIEPSICLTFDSMSNAHSVWKLRRAKPEERMILWQGDSQTESSSYFATPSVLPSLAPQSLSRGRPKTDPRSNSPAISVLTATPKRSILHSPLSLANTPWRSPSVSFLNTRLFTPSPLSRSAKSQTRLSDFSEQDHRPSTSWASCSQLEAGKGHNGQPLLPQLCLEHIWVEPDDKNLLKVTSKAFLTSDVIGQNFVAWVDKKQKKLSVVRYEESRINKLNFALVQSIPAVDAEPLTDLKMILVLEPSGNLVLYSGLHKMARVHIPLNPDRIPSLSLIEESYVLQRLSLDSNEPDRLDSLKRPSTISLRNILSTPGVPFRRSSLINSRPPSVLEPFEDASISLSPVLRLQQTGCSPLLLNESSSYQAADSISITGLKDAVQNRVGLVYGNGTVLRTSIPELASSSLVKRCLEAIKVVLPHNLAVVCFARFYAGRNAPGPCNHCPSGEWNLLSNTLLTLMGYAPSVVEFVQSMNGGTKNSDVSWSPQAFDAKRSKPSEMGDEEDWYYMLSSNYHHTLGRKLRDVLGYSMALTRREPKTKLQIVPVNKSALLFSHMPAILYTLHLVYEDSKLDTLCWPDLVQLVKVLTFLAWDLGWKLYVDLYWRDFPWTVSVLQNERNLTEQDLKLLVQPSFVSYRPPCAYQHLWNILNNDQNDETFPYISGINDVSRDIITIYGILLGTLLNGEFAIKRYIKGVDFPNSSTTSICNISVKSARFWHRNEAAILYMAEKGFTPLRLDRVPPGVALPLRNAIYQSQDQPPSGWPANAYALMGRGDLIYTVSKYEPTKQITVTEEIQRKASAKEEDDGLSDLDIEVLNLVFPKDQRIHDVRKFLCSSKPVPITLVQRPEVSDHEFIEEQERHLYAICVRTMALPVGRGMVSMFCGSTLLTQPVSIPRLCLTGRVPPRDTAVDLSHIDVPSHMALWPAFHHGVATGLKIPPGHPNIDSAWICFNKPKGATDVQPEHAGFLLALGLTGHLSKLSTLAINDYLSKAQELTSLALLLGLGVANKGTQDSSITRLMAVHVEALLPPTCTELNVPQHVQIGALMGLGWLYVSSAHRRMSEILLAEIGRPPGPEMENCTDREAYSLTAGLALGLVTLGRGEDMAGLMDLELADTLYYYMVGGNQRAWNGPQKDKYKTPSYQIREGERVNIDVTSAGATLALGLMFHRTGNKAVAEWMDAPHTQYLLDYVRPDFLLLRTLAKGLILWDDINPNKIWVESHIPDAIKPYCLRRPSPEDDQDVDFETMNQAYCNILCGACLALGLKFAGSRNQTAFNTLFHYTKAFATISGRSVAELAGKSTIETCLNIMLLALAMVMSGSGDLQVLCLCRYLRSRIGPSHSVVTYGSHIATHMALGLLFLGGGKCSLATNPVAVAALVCACYPKFPTHSNDNRYHLQAFRHLYVIATEPRLIIPRDLSTGKPCYAHLRVIFDNVELCGSTEFRMRAPCMLPELKYLKEVTVDDERYWAVSFQRDKNWEALKSILAGVIQTHDKSGAKVLRLKQKVGFLSYQDDPQGFKSMRAQGLSTSAHTPWLIQPSNIFSLSSLASVQHTCHHFLDGSKVVRKSEAKILQFLATILYECVKQEKLEIFLPWISFLQSESSSQGSQSTFCVWQLKFLLSSVSLNQTQMPVAQNFSTPRHVTPSVRFSIVDTPIVEGIVEDYDGLTEKVFVTPEMALALEERMQLILSQWKIQIQDTLVHYAAGDWNTMSEENSFKLACYLLLRNVPCSIPATNDCNPLAYALQLKQKGLKVEFASQLSTLIMNML